MPNQFEHTLAKLVAEGVLSVENIEGLDARSYGRIGEILRRMARTCEAAASDPDQAGEVWASATIGTDVEGGTMIMMQVEVTIGPNSLMPDIPVK